MSYTAKPPFTGLSNNVAAPNQPPSQGQAQPAKPDASQIQNFSGAGGSAQSQPLGGNIGASPNVMTPFQQTLLLQQQQQYFQFQQQPQHQQHHQPQTSQPSAGHEALCMSARFVLN